MKNSRTPSDVCDGSINVVKSFNALTGFRVTDVTLPYAEEVLPIIVSSAAKSSVFVGSKKSLFRPELAPVPFTTAVAPDV